MTDPETPPDTCEVYIIDEGAVRRAREEMAGEATVEALAATFKILGDPTRLRIVMALQHAELCVCALSSLLGVTPSAVSHQLRLLRQHRLVKFRREGKMAYYSLDDDHIVSLLAEGLRHVQEPA